MFSAPFGLSFFIFAVAPSQIGHQDVAALIARQPAVTAHWRQHVRASAFGTIQAATFSFSRPIGTAMPQPLSYQLASLDPRMFSLGPWNAPGQPDDPPLQFPTVDRSAKGDRQPVLHPQRREPEPETAKAPPETPVAATTPEPEPAAAPVESEPVESAAVPAEAEQVEAAAAPAEAEQVEAAAAPAEAEQVEAAAVPAEAEQVQATAAPVEAEQVEAAAAPTEAEQVEAAAAPTEAEQVESAAAPAESLPAEPAQQAVSAAPEDSPAVAVEAEAKIETPEAVAEIPAAETPSTENAAVQTPAEEPAVVKTPAVEIPPKETAVAETPVMETPAADTAVEAPAAETSVAETSAAETPIAEASATDIPDPVDLVIAEASDFVPPRPVEPVVEMARLYFGDQPLGDAPGAIERWAPGEEPTIIAPQAAPADPDIKQSALDPKPQPAEEKGGETIAPKGEVTGEGKRPITPAERLALEGKSRAKAEKCLANAVYFEARGEPVRGQIAVAQVVMNRVFSGYYPQNVCATVYQNAHRRLACQFTFACDGIPDTITEPQAWVRATSIARDVLDGKYWLPEVNRATHYHAYWVRPSWVREMKRLYKFGVHTFYRPRAWGDGSDVPSWGTAAATSEAIAKL